MEGPIYREPADLLETGERSKGNKPDINTFPHQDGCQLSKRLKKGSAYKAVACGLMVPVMRLKALVPAMRPKALAPAMILTVRR